MSGRNQGYIAAAIMGLFSFSAMGGYLIGVSNYPEQKQ
jgi:hypothetical protein